MTTHTHCDNCDRIIGDMAIPHAQIEIRVHGGAATDLEDADICVKCNREVGDPIAEVLRDDD